MESSTSWDVRSIIHTWPVLVFLATLLLIFLLPMGRILRRTGHNPFWCVLAVVPVLNLFVLWFLAFRGWSANEKPLL